MKSVFFFLSTWNEEKKRSMKSLVTRRLLEALVDSSVKKMKTTWWIPSRGMRVRVDLASLRWRRRRRGGTRGDQVSGSRRQRLRNPSRPSPELVVGVSHLVSSQFGHQDFNDVDEDQEVDL